MVFHQRVINYHVFSKFSACYCILRQFLQQFFFPLVLERANSVEEMLETRQSPSPSDGDPHICTALKVAYCIVSNI